MNIVMGGDHDQMRYACAEAKAHGEKFVLFENLDFNNPEHALKEGERVTIRGHGNLQRWGGTEETGNVGLTPKDFVTQLKAKNFPKDKNITLDFIGCGIGLADPQTHTSYVDNVAKMLSVEGYEIKLNAVRDLNTQNNYHQMILYAPSNYGEEIPAPVLLTQAENNLLISDYTKNNTPIQQSLKKQLNNIDRLDASEAILRWKGVNPDVINFKKN
jgi:paraquat-inducible protein B